MKLIYVKDNMMWSNIYKLKGNNNFDEINWIFF